MTVRAKDSAWVSIKSDGKFAVRGIIRPPDVKTVRASDQVVFWTGNAGAVEVSFNGQPVPLAGGPNQEGVLVFNSHGAVIAEAGTMKRDPEAGILNLMKNIAENVVRIEAEALRALADRIAGPMAPDFERAIDLLYSCAGRVVVTGMGKSGLIARKVAATLSSTGTPALYLHPAEAMHGDLGMIVRGDAVVAMSASGETGEILQLLATVKRLGVPLITLTCDDLYSPSAADRRRSTLAQAADVALDCSVASEACSFGLAPTASTTTMLALGDALAVALSQKRGFKEEDFANLHPGGKLGKRLTRVSALMHSGDALPSVTPSTPISQVIYEMSRKGLGMTTVVEDGKLVGRHQRRRLATLARAPRQRSI